MVTPLAFIAFLSASDDYIRTIYLNGSCYRFYKLLKRLYPDAEPYILHDPAHVITKIGDIFYDIRGVLTQEQTKGFTPMSDYDHHVARQWSFHENHMLKLKECPHCGEDIVLEDIETMY